MIFLRPAFLLLITFYILHFTSFAQRPEGQGNRNTPAIGKVYGKILDANTRQPVEFASVAAYSVKKDSIIAGVLVKQNGDFALENLPLIPLKIKVSFLGYKSLEQTVTLNMQNTEQDLGNLKLELDTKVLNEVVIGEEKSTMTMSIDRKVYNVEKDISTQGGTAEDVMKNIPSVDVDEDGNPTLRNSNTQVYVDGRPTSMTLNQIPADQIERVEVITNASVKFDASTSGGILNIVLKKNLKPGYNGMISAGIGTNQRYNATGNLNIRQNKVNVSTSYSFNNSRNFNNGYSYRTNRSNDAVTGYFNQDNVNDEVGTMHNGRLGLDIDLNNRNFVSFSGNFSYRLNDSDDGQEFSYADANNVITATGSRNNRQVNNHYNTSASAFFKHSFPKKGEELTADFNYEYSYSAREYLFTTNNYDSLQTLLPENPQLQRNDGYSESNQFVFQLDYVNPLTENSKIEVGVRSFYKPYDAVNLTENFDYANNSYVKDSILSSVYHIDELINAAYINYLGKMWWNIKYQVGFRFEQSYFKGKLTDRGLDFSYSYPSGGSNIFGAIFPGIYFTKEIKKNHDIQLNFSRKLNRPRFWQLNPFVMGADQQNIRIGNPGLKPEFTNMGELNYNPRGDKFNLVSSLYFKLTENDITFVAFPSEDDSTVLVNTWANTKNSFSYGWDNSLKLTLIKSLDIMLSADVNYVKVTSADGLTQNSGFNWSGKAGITYRLPKDFTIQLNADYRGPRVILQGSGLERYSFDVSISKSIKRKWKFNLILNDAFNTHRWGAIYDTPFYYQESSRRRESRFLRFTVTYNFGEQETLFKKRSQKRTGGGGDDDGDF